MPCLLARRHADAVADYQQQLDVYRAGSALGSQGGHGVPLTPSLSASAAAAKVRLRRAGQPIPRPTNPDPPPLAQIPVHGWRQPLKAELRDAVDKLERALTENEDLAGQVARLTAGLATATAAVDDHAQRVAALQAAVRAADAAHAALSAEHAALQTQHDDLAAVHAAAVARDDDLVQQVHDTVAQWQAALGDKEAELAAAMAVNAALRHEFESTRSIHLGAAAVFSRRWLLTCLLARLLAAAPGGGFCICPFCLAIAALDEEGLVLLFF